MADCPANKRYGLDADGSMVLLESVVCDDCNLGRTIQSRSKLTGAIKHRHDASCTCMADMQRLLAEGAASHKRLLASV